MNELILFGTFPKTFTLLLFFLCDFKDLKADDPEINDAIHATYYDKNSICGCRTICIVHVM